MRADEFGESSEGLMTTGQPAAMAPTKGDKVSCHGKFWEGHQIVSRIFWWLVERTHGLMI